MISINDSFPDFNLEAALDGKIINICKNDLKGKWAVIFFYPEDFSFICPTEVTGFEKYREYFEIKDTKLIGVSTDDVKTHVEWQEELEVNYPLASDKNGKLAKAVGVLDPEDNRANRATFIIDPKGKVQFAMVTSRNIGRSVEETLRVYHAINLGKACPDYKSKEMR